MKTSKRSPQTPLAERPRALQPIVIRVFGGRAHQTAAYDKPSPQQAEDEELRHGPVRLLVRNGRPLTPEGRLLLAGGSREAPKVLRGF